MPESPSADFPAYPFLRAETGVVCGTRILAKMENSLHVFDSDFHLIKKIIIKARVIFFDITAKIP